MLIGTTYSHREIEWLKLDADASLQALLDFKFDIVRLGVYWDESQPQSKVFDFAAIDKVIQVCEQANQKIVVSIGAKAPRWPEYYVPTWLKAESPEQLKQPLVTFVQEAVVHLKKYQNITAWQVENEPLDQSGPLGWAIPLDLLQQEVALVRQLDNRPIHLNCWGDNALKRPDVADIFQLADSIGLDIYFRQPAENLTYHGPNFKDWQLRWWIWRQKKPIWITELQSEPWEHDNQTKFTTNPGSMNPELLRQNFNRVKKLRLQTILFWGFEYWLWAAGQGRPQLLEAARGLVKANR